MSIKPHSLIYNFIHNFTIFNNYMNAHERVTHSHTMHYYFGLSPKDMRSHPNTLPIRSLPGVNFWVFHPRDLSPFLVHLTRAFTFHHYFIFFHFIHFSQFFFFHTTMMQMNATNSNIPQ